MGHKRSKLVVYGKTVGKNIYREKGQQPRFESCFLWVRAADLNLAGKQNSKPVAECRLPVKRKAAPDIHGEVRANLPENFKKTTKTRRKPREEEERDRRKRSLKSETKKSPACPGCQALDTGKEKTDGGLRGIAARRRAK